MGDAGPPQGDNVSGIGQHHRGDPRRVACMVVTVSDTRSVDTDTSGAEIVRLLVEAGHSVVDRIVVPDASEGLRAAVVAATDDPRIDALLITGGTGIAPRDQTPEILGPLLDLELPGFGELFRAISFEEIGPSAMLSRAIAGRRGTTVMFAMPGSTAAVRTAMGQLILPVIVHAVGQASRF